MLHFLYLRLVLLLPALIHALLVLQHLLQFEEFGLR